MLLNCGAGEDSSPSDCKEIKLINPKGNQSWIIIGRTNAEFPILWPPVVKSQIIGKNPDVEKDWRQEEKGTAEGEMVGGISISMDMNWSKLQEIVEDSEAWCSAVPEITKSPWAHKEYNLAIE